MTRRPKPRLLEAEAGQKTRREKHGVIGYLNTGKLPSGRAWERVQVEVRRTREALIKQYGGDKIRPDVLALVESACEALVVQKLSALYVKKAGIMRADSLGKGNLELHSVLCGQFISYANLVRASLTSAATLASQKGPEDEAFDITAYAQEFDKRADREAEVDREKAVVRPGNAPEGQSPEDEAGDTEETR
jgi:hypothetical protein